MKEQELAGLLDRAEQEINRLRRRNEVLEAVDKVVNLFGAALHAEAPRQGASIDIAWELRNEAENLRAKSGERA